MTVTICSTAARDLDEPLAGTATRTVGYLVIEQPGSWGRDALTGSDLDAVLGAQLKTQAAAADVKVLLVRRPGPHPSRPIERYEVLLAHVGPTPWMERCQLSAAELAHLDPAECAAPQPVGRGQATTSPRWLVCTHARRDRCCATLGRPIADTLAALHPEQTWEVSHLGGHRFAGTMLTLPEGLLYGNLDVAAAMEVVHAHTDGRVVADQLRGRVHLPPVAQVAEVAVRRALGLDAIDAVDITDVPVLPPAVDGSAVAVAAWAQGRQVQVRIRRVRDDAVRPSSCDGELEPLERLEVVDVEVVG